MTTRRHAAVSGSFYPTSAVELRATVEVLIAEAVATPTPPPKALIAPHAGYVCSGPVAASAYASLYSSLRGAIERVVIVGPAHYVPLQGIATTHAHAFTTPLGDLMVDEDASSELERLAHVRHDETAHAPEHSIEVHLPFLQVVLGDVRIVPLLVGEADAEDVVRVLDAMWGGDETLVVVSSDLSHDQEPERARRLDAATTSAIENLDASAIGDESACGAVALRGLLLEARAHALRATTLDVRTSSDTAGTRSEVVGYGAYVLA
jgi:hypothetical protein